MKIKRIAALVAVVSVGALVLAGCAPADDTPKSEIKAGTAVSIAQNSAFTSYNPAAAADNSTYNSNITYLTNASFNYYDNSPKLVKNTKFGTYTKTSDDPLTIKYTINKGVKWSDGSKVDAADMLLAWLRPRPSGTPRTSASVLPVLAQSVRSRRFRRSATVARP